MAYIGFVDTYKWVLVLLSLPVCFGTKLPY